MAPEPQPRPAISRPPAAEPPVARRAARWPRIRLRPTAEAPPPAHGPDRRALGGWAVSLALHASLLLVLGLWYFSADVEPERIITGRVAGQEIGDLSGDPFAGDLGLDSTLILPELPPLEVPSFRPLQPVVRVTPDPAILPPLLDDDRTPISPASAARGEGSGFGIVQFGSGTEQVQGIEVQVGDPQFTLIWEGRADLDLHVEEPGGTEISWKDREGEHGGRLDVDKRTGPGPENVYWEQGAGPPGQYRWYVAYYGPEPFRPYAGPIRWRVRVKHAGQITEYSGTLRRIDDRSKIHSLRIGRGG